MNAAVKEYQEKQIGKANYIINKAECKISEIEEQINLLKNQLKEQKSIIAKAKKDIEYYSM